MQCFSGFWSANATDNISYTGLALSWLADVCSARTKLNITSRVAIAAMLVATHAYAGNPVQTGTATVIDGDTLSIDGVRHRLSAIDAPESEQTCERGGTTWLCGQEAAKMLRELVRGKTVRCETSELDRYGRRVSVCYVGTSNLNSTMVQDGYALAYRQYGTEYVDEEDSARQAKRGLWSGEFDAPWDWRRTGNPVPEGVADCENPIKGNINSKGRRLYHRPGDRSYAATKINESYGERWFCSEREAEDAGWEAAFPR